MFIDKLNVFKGYRKKENERNKYSQGGYLEGIKRFKALFYKDKRSSPDNCQGYQNQPV